MPPLPTREDYFARWASLHGGYDPAGSAMVGTWLRVVYVCARPLAAARVPPDLVTLLGLLVSGVAALMAVAGGAWLWAASVAVVLAGLLDNLDGAVAVLSDRTSRWGSVLDSVVDRCSDALFLVALWAAGATAGVCVVGGVLVGLLEYARARAGVAGMSEVGVVTVAERPTRVLVTAAFLAAAAAFPVEASTWAGRGAWVWLAVSAFGLVQLLVVVRRRLVTGPTD